MGRRKTKATKPKGRVKKAKSKKQQDQVVELKVNEKASEKEQPVCRICLCEDAETDNPLIAPCKCAGSTRFIHH